MGAGGSKGEGPLAELKYSWPLRFADSVRRAGRWGAGAGVAAAATAARLAAAAARPCIALEAPQQPSTAGIAQMPQHALGCHRPAAARLTPRIAPLALSLSAPPSPPPNTRAQPVKYASASSLAVIKRPDGARWLALAYQASEDSAYEGSRGQHVRFALSKDGGESWGASTAVAWGVAPIWSPSLHYDAGACWRRWHCRCCCCSRASAVLLLVRRRSTTPLPRPLPRPLCSLRPPLPLLQREPQEPVAGRGRQDGDQQRSGGHLGAARRHLLARGAGGGAQGGCCLGACYSWGLLLLWASVTVQLQPLRSSLCCRPTGAVHPALALTLCRCAARGCWWPETAPGTCLVSGGVGLLRTGAQQLLGSPCRGRAAQQC